MKKIFLFMLIFLMPFVVRAEELKLEWQKSWGGNGNGYDQFRDIVQTSDDGFVVVGDSISTDIEGLPNKGNYDAIIVKYDKSGNEVWKQSWGGNYNDRFNKILLLDDESIVVSGYSYSTDIEGLSSGENINSAAVIVKYDKDGNMLWQNSFGGNYSNVFQNIFLTEDGSIMVVGHFYSTNIEGVSYRGKSDLILLKYNSDGNLLWKKSWGGSGVDFLYDALQTPDGEFVLSGYSDSTDITGLTNKGKEDAVIIMFDKDGNMLWQNSFGGNDQDQFKYILNTSDGGFVVVGDFKSSDIENFPNMGDCDIILVKYDKDGNMLWQTSWGGSGVDWLLDVLKTPDDELVISGYTQSTDIDGLINKGKEDAVIVKYDKDGNILWQNSFGGNDFDKYEQILVYDKFIIAVGSVKSTNVIDIESNRGGVDAIIVKYDKDGGQILQKSWGGNSGDIFYDLIQSSDNGLILFAVSNSTNIDNLSNRGGIDTFLVKYLIEYNLEMLDAEDGTPIIEQQGKYGIITPTPNEGYEVDKIIIKDKDGNALDVEVIKLENGTYSFELYTDVIIEVTFKVEIVNPKTGFINLSIIFGGLVIIMSMFYFCIRYFDRNNYSNL